MKPKALTCMDDEVFIEIDLPKDDTQDLIISLSITPTYMIPDALEIFNQNKDRTQASRDAHLMQSFVM